MKIKVPRISGPGVMFIGTGLFFLVWAYAYYQMGTAVRMGPGVFPGRARRPARVLGAHRAARVVRDAGPAGPEVRASAR